MRAFAHALVIRYHLTPVPFRMRSIARAPVARSAPARAAPVVPRRAAATKSDVQASKASNLSAERAAQKEVMRAHRRCVSFGYTLSSLFLSSQCYPCSKLASIFQNWKQTDAGEGYMYTDKETVRNYMKKAPSLCYYDIGMGRVDPEVLKELYEEERAKVVAKPQAEKDEFRRALRETVEPKLEKLYVLVSMRGRRLSFARSSWHHS